MITNLRGGYAERLARRARVNKRMKEGKEVKVYPHKISDKDFIKSLPNPAFLHKADGTRLTKKELKGFLIFYREFFEGEQKMGETTCKKCKYLMELLQRTPMTNRDYWIMTELFVLLHGGDVCKG